MAAPASVATRVVRKGQSPSPARGCRRRCSFCLIATATVLAHSWAGPPLLASDTHERQSA
jgi:hypothetical protein